MATELVRIESFIDLAKKGKKVDLKIELEKQIVSQKTHLGDSKENKSPIDLYLLIGNYIFEVDGIVNKVSKVYVYGNTAESFLDGAKINKSIANLRLKMDYKRLTDANIKFEEKYFKI